MSEENEEENEEHRRKINRAAASAIFGNIEISEGTAIGIIKQIAMGNIPNVSIRY